MKLAPVPTETEPLASAYQVSVPPAPTAVKVAVLPAQTAAPVPVGPAGTALIFTVTAVPVLTQPLAFATAT